MSQNKDDTQHTDAQYEAYRDEELEQALKRLKTYSLQELQDLQIKIATKLSDATDEFNSKKTDISMAKRRYYLRIVVEVMIEIWRFFRGKTPLATKESLRQKSDDLKKNHQETSEKLNQQMSEVETSIQSIKTLSDDILLKENDLDTLKKSIESIDTTLHQLAPGSDDFRMFQESMITKIEIRDTLSKELAELYQRIERAMNVWSNAFHSLSKSFVAERNIAYQNALEALKMRCEVIDHPVIKKLHTFLHHQTDVSLQALRDAIAKDDSFQESRALVELLWDAGKVDSRIIKGLTREEALPSISDIQASNSAKIKDIDERLKSYIEEEKHQSHRLTQLMIDKEKLTGVPGEGYITAAQLRKIKASSMPDYQAIMNLQRGITGLMTDKAELRGYITEMETEKKIYMNRNIVFTPAMLQALVVKCDTKPKHPVTTALQRFLEYPTPSLLKKLKIAMNEYKEDKLGPNIQALLEEANRYFPYVLDHPTLLAEKNKQGFTESKLQYQAFKNQHAQSASDQENSDNTQRFKR